MKLFLVALVCIISIWSTQAYQCYRCDSDSSPSCDDPFNNAQAEARWKVDAKPNERCKKVKVSGALVSRDAVDVKECEAGENKCLTADVPFLGKSTTCCCTSDLCNGVSSVRQQPFIIFGIISILIMFIYRRF